MHGEYCQVSLFDLLQFAWVALHESMPSLLLLFDIHCSCASAKPFELPLPTIAVGDRGAGMAAALPTMEKFAKICHNRAENQPKVGQNFRTQWIFYRAAPLNVLLLTLMLPTVIGGCGSNQIIEKSICLKIFKRNPVKC